MHMKQTYESPCIILIEASPECLNSYSGVQDMQNTSVFIETLDGE